MNKISLQDVKQALRDPKFRKTLSDEFAEEMQKYEQNPGCACNLPIYRKILKYAQLQLQEYFPGREVTNTSDEEIERLAENNWSVINCHVNDLEDRLKRLGHGRKQIAIARYEDKVTVIVNDLNAIF